MNKADGRKNVQKQEGKKKKSPERNWLKIQSKDSPKTALNNAAIRLPCAELPVASIKRDEQVRKSLHIESAAFKTLADSIEKQGLVQPILVRQKGDDLFLVAGSRRLQAYKALGRQTIPALVVDGTNTSKEKVLLLQLTENLQRERLNPIYEALAYSDYLTSRLGVDIQKAKSDIENYGRHPERLNEKTKEAIDVLRRVSGKSAATIWRHLSLLDDLNPAVQEEIRKGTLRPAQARAFVRQERHPRFEAILQLAVQKKLAAGQIRKLFERKAKRKQKQEIKGLNRETRQEWMLRIQRLYIDLMAQRAKCSLVDLSATLKLIKVLMKGLRTVIRAREGAGAAWPGKEPRPLSKPLRTRPQAVSQRAEPTASNGRLFPKLKSGLTS